MKLVLFMFTSSLILSACSATDVDRTDTAECSRLMAQIVQPNTPQRGAGDNFIGQYQRAKNSDAAREHARKAGCLK